MSSRFDEDIRGDATGAKNSEKATAGKGGNGDIQMDPHAYHSLIFFI